MATEFWPAYCACRPAFRSWVSDCLPLELGLDPPHAAASRSPATPKSRGEIRYLAVKSRAEITRNERADIVVSHGNPPGPGRSAGRGGAVGLLRRRAQRGGEPDRLSHLDPPARLDQRRPRGPVAGGRDL